MQQNTTATAVTVSELLREKQQEGRGCRITTPPD